MIDDKMCFGIIKEDLMARVGVDNYEELVEREGLRPMDFIKPQMKGGGYVAPEGIVFQYDIEFWIQKALGFNPYALTSKSKKKKK